MPWPDTKIAALAMLLTATGAASAAPAPCPGPALPIRALADGVWLISGSTGDSNAINQGRISNLLAVREGRRLWLLGSGPDARFARALDCQLARHAGRRVSDVIAPWPRPELVLGQGGLPATRRWAHEEVAAAMRERCPQCVERLAQRRDLPAGTPAEPVVLPERLLRGTRGRLGPWRWHRLMRSDTTAVTVWQLPRQRIAAAHGLLWSDGAPDLRDARIAVMKTSLQALSALQQQPDGPLHWLPEQGEMLGAQAPAGHRAYLETLERQADRAMEDGTQESDPPPAPEAAAMAAGLRHGLNWQHAWREAEARWFGATAPR